MNDLTYLEHQVLTASPYQLHLMVVEGALRHSRSALEFMQNKDYEQTHIYLSNARDFMTELIGGLNDEYSPEIVGNLKSLFNFAYKNLVQADFVRNPDFINNAIRVLELHRETWIELKERLGVQSQFVQPQPIESQEDDYHPGSFSLDS